MTRKGKRLTVLSDAEQYALYGLPDFDDGQQSEYLSLSAERQRLGALLTRVVDDTTKDALAQLLVRDHTLSKLAALKQDAKDFG